VFYRTTKLHAKLRKPLTERQQSDTNMRNLQYVDSKAEKEQALNSNIFVFALADKAVGSVVDRMQKMADRNDLRDRLVQSNTI
jgi:hypothetical protein